ncbi:MAG: hypothetical protein RMJ98_02800 [Myxococcales bacterium]|nr:hypothetical protein [Polyangiaceae bacterium]MDW8248219.1 hypothetical protein [Myxococcales bacterium]
MPPLPPNFPSSQRLLLVLLAVSCLSPASSLPEEVSSLNQELIQEVHTLGANPSGVWSISTPAIALQLPSTAAGTVALKSPRGALTFRLADAYPTPGAISEEEARYDGALGEGTTLLLTRRPDGVEDRIVFRHRPPREYVDYFVDVRAVAGLRKIDKVIEFLDESGAPRLRMEAPYLEDADGRLVQAKVEVGCAYDEDPRGPWGRPVIKPGAAECRIRLEWSRATLTYPAVLDPVWATTTAMAKDRAFAVYGRLDSGRFLVAGGRACKSGNCSNLLSTEIYDPATGTWAQGSLFNTAHSAGASMAVPGLGIVAIGHDGTNNSPFDAAELYREDTGFWEMLPPMTEGRQEAMVVLRADQNKIYVITGLDPTSKLPRSSVEVLDLTTKTWSYGGSMLHSRYLSTATLLPDGKILLAGGSACTSCGPLADVELYDPATKTSVAMDSLLQPHFGHAAAVLPIQGKPKVLIAGGGSEECELFDIETKKWSFTGSLSSKLVYAASSLLSDGSFLVAGGILLPGLEGNTIAERFDPSTLTWKPAGLTTPEHGAPAFTLLSGDRFLLAGGTKNNFLAGTNTSGIVEIFQPLPLAQPCQGGGECMSQHCVDGVCCDKPCNGVCEACSAAKKGSGADGSCGPVASDTDPDDECPTEDKSTCGTSGFCDGKGACARYPVNTPCGSAECKNGVASGLLCTADGKCQQQVNPCDPYFCKDPTACATKTDGCAEDSQCAPSGYCEGKECRADRKQGEACERGAQCLSGFCVDGVCCASACEGTCQACASALKQDGSPDGICAPALLDTDPHDDCSDEPLLGCDRNGLCDGKGACALYAAGTVCQPSICESDGQGGFRLGIFTCDGSGTCQAAQGASCGAFGCEQGTCKTSCQSDGDCAEKAYCSEGNCLPRKELGKSCSAPRECLGGLCVDGVCCSSPCDGPCEACNKEGALGLCVPVSGTPFPGHPPCAKASEGQPCQQRICDGVIRETCAGFVGPEVICRAPSCSDGVAVIPATCDGKGACPEEEIARCEPFVCNGNTCGSSCTSDSDCERRFQCDMGTGDCVPRTTAVCDGEHTLINPDGTTTDCAPYTCEGSSCKTQCSSVKDCVLPNICDEATRTCIPARPNPTETSGCSTAPGSSGQSFLPMLIALMLLCKRRARGGVPREV